MIDINFYRNCSHCPRACGAKRLSGGNCSGTLFFAGGALRCTFCQNYDISHLHVGEPPG